MSRRQPELSSFSEVKSVIGLLLIVASTITRGILITSRV